ncbi:MAG: UDP-glucose 4-epimerase GalE [Bacteroidota bacterium]|jgi:UDP-glucose 4-epimerase|nr:UDP-glucose 4-epimerase GalE [Bacteroidota bacterium]MCA6444607.1 UDP-glucose 4-epimerase GalE [Bacteroidota bacterium]
MKTIIVTGGAGYIGSHTLIELLQTTDFKIVSIDNYSNSDASTYQRVSQITNKPFDQIDIDLCDKKALNESLNKYPKIDGIIHFAAFKTVPESVTLPVKYYNNNLVSLLNLLDYCKEKNIRHFIFSSSCSVYGNADELPVTEETPLKKAESSYAHTKQIGEEILNYFAPSVPDFKAIILRYFNPVGAHISGLNGELPISKPNNLVPIITQTASGKNNLTVFGNDYNTPDGTCIRDYIHVTDIATAHVKALLYLFESGAPEKLSVFNLGTGKGVSVLEAIKSFEKMSGQQLNYTIGGRRAGDVIAVYANNEKAKTKLKWEPQLTIDDMMLSAWKWQENLNKGLVKLYS